nr:hypothetical protein [Desulfobulbaceae bacterium]
MSRDEVVGTVEAVQRAVISAKITGTVAEIAPTGDAISRTSVVKLDLVAADTLRPGQFVRVVIPGREVTTLTVPETALSVFGQMERIFVVENNIAHLRLIRSGTRRYGQLYEHARWLLEKSIYPHAYFPGSIATQKHRPCQPLVE